MTLLHLGILAVLTFGLRVFPRLILPYATSSDSYYHLLAADRIRGNRFHLPGRLQGLFFPGPYDYPPLFHFLLALFPTRLHLHVERVISPVIDVLYVWLCYGFVTYLLNTLQSLEAREVFQRAFWVAAVFSVSPGLLYCGKGPRPYNANPRILSELIFAGAMICTFWWFVGSGWGAFIAASALIAVLLLGSKFGAQVVAFFFPLLALMLSEPGLLLLPLVGFVLALIPFRGHYLRVLRGHIGHLALFAQVDAHKDLPTARKSEWGTFFRLLTSPFRLGALFRLFCLNSISCFFIRNPQLLVLALVGSWWTYYHSTVSFLLAWIVGSLAVFLVTTCRRLLFMGEPERYVSYALLPQFALLALAWERIPSSVWLGFVAYSVLASIAYVWAFLGVSYRDPDVVERNRELHEFLGRRDVPRWILPVSVGPYHLAYATGQEVFYPSGNFELWHTPSAEYLRIYESFACPRAETLSETISRYGINTLVVRKGTEGSLPMALQGFRKVFENTLYDVYEGPELNSRAEPFVEELESRASS